jgi:predicted nuclease with TOPRIM domain
MRNILSASVSDMEAAVADKEAEMTEWNDDRHDDLYKRVERIEGKVDEQSKTMQKEFSGVGRKFTEIDGRFVRVGERFDEMARHFGRVESELVRINDRLDGFQRSMTWVAWSMVIGLLGLLGVLIGIIATKF